MDVVGVSCDWTRNEGMRKDKEKLMLKEALGLKGRNGCCRCPM